jgi:hypothetical protein
VVWMPWPAAAGIACRKKQQQASALLGMRPHAGTLHMQEKAPHRQGASAP